MLEGHVDAMTSIFMKRKQRVPAIKTKKERGSRKVTAIIGTISTIIKPERRNIKPKQSTNKTPQLAQPVNAVDAKKASKPKKSYPHSAIQPRKKPAQTNQVSQLESFGSVRALVKWLPRNASIKIPPLVTLCDSHIDNFRKLQWIYGL